MCELVQCPFCGKADAMTTILDYEDSGMWRAVCSARQGGCGSTSGFKDTEQLAIAAWNTRIPSAAPGYVMRIGDEVRVTEGFAYQEWRNDRLWIAGLAMEPRGKLNITVSTRWPVETLGDLTDGFRIGDLALAAADTAPSPKDPTT